MSGTARLTLHSWHWSPDPSPALQDSAAHFGSLCMGGLVIRGSAGAEGHEVGEHTKTETGCQGVRAHKEGGASDRAGSERGRSQ